MMQCRCLRTWCHVWAHVRGDTSTDAHVCQCPVVCPYWIHVNNDTLFVLFIMIIMIIIAKQHITSVKQAEGDFKDVLVATDISLMNYLYVHLSHADFPFRVSASVGEFWQVRVFFFLLFFLNLIWEKNMSTDFEWFTDGLPHEVRI